MGGFTLLQNVVTELRDLLGTEQVVTQQLLGLEGLLQVPQAQDDQAGKTKWRRAKDSAYGLSLFLRVVNTKKHTEIKLI